MINDQCIMKLWYYIMTLFHYSIHHINKCWPIDSINDDWWVIIGRRCLHQCSSCCEPSRTDRNVRSRCSLRLPPAFVSFNHFSTVNRARYTNDELQHNRVSLLQYNRLFHCTTVLYRPMIDSSDQVDALECYS